MQGGNFFINAGKLLFSILLDFLYFPIWWYSKGVIVVLHKLVDFLKQREKSLVLLVWIKNLGKPMYSMYTWEGIIISFFVRLFQIIFRGIIFMMWAALCLAVFIFWLILPVLVAYEIYYQILDFFVKDNLKLFILNF